MRLRAKSRFCDSENHHQLVREAGGRLRTERRRPAQVTDTGNQCTHTCRIERRDVAACNRTAMPLGRGWERVARGGVAGTAGEGFITTNRGTMRRRAIQQRHPCACGTVLHPGIWIACSENARHIRSKLPSSPSRPLSPSFFFRCLELEVQRR